MGNNAAGGSYSEPSDFASSSSSMTADNSREYHFKSASIGNRSSATADRVVPFRLINATGPEKATFWWELCCAITSCERQTHFIYLATEHISTPSDTRDLLFAIRKCSEEGKNIYERALLALEGSWDQIDRVIRVDVERKLKSLRKQDGEWNAMADLLDRVTEKQAELESLMSPDPFSTVVIRNEADDVRDDDHAERNSLSHYDDDLIHSGCHRDKDDQREDNNFKNEVE